MRKHIVVELNPKFKLSQGIENFLILNEGGVTLTNKMIYNETTDRHHVVLDVKQIRVKNDENSIHSCIKATNQESIKPGHLLVII